MAFSTHVPLVFYGESVVISGHCFFGSLVKVLESEVNCWWEKLMSHSSFFISMTLFFLSTTKYPTSKSTSLIVTSALRSTKVVL